MYYLCFRSAEERPTIEPRAGYIHQYCRVPAKQHPPPGPGSVLDGTGRSSPEPTHDRHGPAKTAGTQCMVAHFHEPFVIIIPQTARYQNELAVVNTEKLVERFYYQALTVVPQMGMPFNQLGTLAGSKYYHVEATYCYLRCIQSEVTFKGAYGNLKRLYDKAAKMFHQLKKMENRKLSPSKKRCRDIKRLLVSFMYLQRLLQPKSSSVDSELISLCQSVLEDFNLCMFYLPSPLNLSSASKDEEEYDGGYSFLHDLVIFKIVVICLMSVHSLKRADSKQYSADIAFTLALFSHLVNHVNIRLQSELEESSAQPSKMTVQAT
ncbi:nonsense-mediated mRNA decay factor SMG5-like isoform X2 [Pyxicephalus adspersus]|uniref:nonsense-mediated mRNA decay factor SMG5-like isoform X2 n=1 Tax=Pyxicephalus adspersus TaxID=30357 RepID=UPI003B5B794B